MRWLIISLLVVFTIGVPIQALAQAVAEDPPTVFADPLGGVNLPGVLGRIIQFMLGLVGALVFLALIWGAGQIMLSLGDEKRVATGKNTIKWAVYGLVLIILSYMIVFQIMKFFRVT